MIFEEGLYLEHIPSDIFLKLKETLDYNKSWTKIQKCSYIFDIIKPPDTLAPTKSASEHILNKLREKLCTMGNLRDILLESEIYDALAIFYTEKIDIEKQPTYSLRTNQLEVKRRNQLSLEFLCSGIPQPEYRWYKDEILLPEQISSKLFYEKYTPQLAGSYYCIATQTLKNHHTNKTKLEILKSDVVNVVTQLEPCIVTKRLPSDICCKVGDADITLHVKVDGYPKPKFQWTHDNTLLDENTNKLQLRTNINQTGVYRCQISNGLNTLIEETNVKIVDPNYSFPICMEPVIEKVALLIGNEAYENQSELFTPINDTKALKIKLESIGFLVLCENNLNLDEMIKVLEYFCDLCVQGCLALFYYAGHGFEFGEKYLMPIDVPNSEDFGFKDIVSEHRILKEILDKKPKLLVTFLDMCLNFPNIEDNRALFEEKREMYHFKPERNLIQGYSTTTGYSCCEIRVMENSVYNKLLQNYITQKLPVEQMLRCINHEYEKLVKGKLEKLSNQMPTVSHNITQDYYLNVEKIGHPFSKKMVERRKLMKIT